MNGAGYWNPNVTPQREAARYYHVDKAANKKLREQGFTARLAAPEAGIIKGVSALVTTGDGPLAQVILKDRVALHVQLSPHGRSRDQYPNSPMGAVALVRQAFYDANWYQQAWSAYNGGKTHLARPERNNALAALQPYASGKALVVVDAPNELYFLRAERLAHEFSLNVVVRGSGKEYRRLDAIKKSGFAVIVPLNFPKAPYVKTPEMAQAASLEDLLQWDIAPENPGRLAAAGVPIALTPHGLSDPGKFLEAVRTAVKRGLSPDQALQALTVTPAKLCGVASRLGTLEVGKAANLVVADGDLFSKKGKVTETWVDGERFEVTSQPELDVRGAWEVTIAGQSKPALVTLKGQPAKLTGELSLGDKKADLSEPKLDGAQFTCSLDGKEFGWPGRVQLSATVSREQQGQAFWIGGVVWANGQRSPLAAQRKADSDPDAKDGPDQEPDEQASEKKESDKDDKSDHKPKDKPKSTPDPNKALFAVNYPLGAFGREGQPDQPKAVLFKNATVWTSGPQGVLKHGSVLIEGGKIKQVGTNIKPPAGAVVVDLKGQHISPGLIDCHSHIATDGGVNESAQTITAEVRIGDFIDPNDVNIYRQLAGGVTASNILHGSANTIGGQNQVIKMRWGRCPRR